MPLGYVFWIIYIIAILVYGAFNWPLNRSTGAAFVIFILIAILGWHDFGPMVQDSGATSRVITR